MQNGAKESSLKPFPIDFNVDVDFNSHYKYVVIFVCSFYMQRFQVAWDCKVMACGQHTILGV
jgi:hypothetical protein